MKLENFIYRLSKRQSQGLYIRLVNHIDMLTWNEVYFKPSSRQFFPTTCNTRLSQNIIWLLCISRNLHGFTGAEKGQPVWINLRNVGACGIEICFTHT